MKSFAVLKDKTFRLVEVSKPTINKYQALVKILACGVCNGTDIKLAHHTFKNFDEYPALLGHEGVGEVVAVGDMVTTYKVGDICLLPFTDAISDGYYSGWGAYSEYGVVGDINALLKDNIDSDNELYAECYYAQNIIPKEIDPVEATMIITLREVLSAIKRFNIENNANVVIFGAGPVGLTFAKLLNIKGASSIIFDIDDKKVNRAISFGANNAYNSKTNDVKGVVYSHYKDGADFVIDAVGITDLINTSMELIKNCGKICCYGISPNLSMNIDWSNAPYNWSVDFVQWPSKIEESECHNEIITYIEDKKIVLGDFISKVYPLDEINKAFDDIENRNTDLKTVIKINN